MEANRQFVVKIHLLSDVQDLRQPQTSSVTFPFSVCAHEQTLVMPSAPSQYQEQHHHILPVCKVSSISCHTVVTGEGASPLGPFCK